MLENLGQKLIARVRIGPVDIAFDLVALAVAVGVTLVLVGLALWLRRGIPKDSEAPPTRRAALLAVALDMAETQLVGGFVRPLARQLLPLVTTLFLYVLLCNWASILPIPYIISPTQDLNVTLGLAVMVYLLSHWYAVRHKGLGRHLRSYIEPYPFLLPMNLMGDLGRTLSHAFRLFGNILGGGILTAIATSFIPLIFPVFLQAFFGLFIGTIQALVFALLASVYINIAVE
jgi:F-type H+-transporting ATPase subunit a